MFNTIFRSIGAVVASLALAVALIVAIEGISAVFHPFPPGVDGSDCEACKAHVARYPHWLLGVAVIAWGLTTLLSTWLATRLGAFRHPAHGVAVGLLLFLAVIANLLMLPYYLWFELVNLVTIPLAIYFGTQLGRTPSTVVPGTAG